MLGINGSFTGGGVPQVSNVKTSVNVDVSKDSNVRSTGASPVVGSVGRAVPVPHVTPGYVLSALWVALDKPASCPELKDECYFEAELSKLLMSSGLTLDGLKKILKTMPEPNKWAAEVLKDKTVGLYLSAGGPLLLGRAQPLADKFAKVIAKAVQASPKEMVDRKVKVQKPLVTEERKKPKAVAKEVPESVKEDKPETVSTKKNALKINKLALTLVEEKVAAPVAESAEKVVNAATACSESSDSRSGTSMQSTLDSLWRELQKHNAGLERPAASSADDALYAIDDLLYESGMTTGQLKSALTAINEPWAQACLVDSAMTRNMKNSSGRVSDSPRTFAETILAYMNGKPAEALMDKKAIPAPKPVNNTVAGEGKKGPVDFKAGAKKVPDRVETKKPQPPIVTQPEKKPVHHPVLRAPQPVLIKKQWQSNREDKNCTGLPFTRVQAETPTGQLFHAELLNTLPDTVLINNGWTQDAVNKLPQERRWHALSRSAKEALGLQGDVVKGRYFGEGAYGKVKLARVYLPGSAEPTICVAKKIIKRDGVDFYGTLEELELQNKSGVAPKIYGVSDTKSRDEKRQFILFMEPARGSDGREYISHEKRKMTFEAKCLLAENYTSRISSMHENRIFHKDLKLENSYIDPATKDVQILDFGLAQEGKQAGMGGLYGRGPRYIAPELFHDGAYSRGVLNAEKLDVYSLGVILGEIFGSGHGSYVNERQWDSYSLRSAGHAISSQLDRLRITDAGILSLVRDMMQENPSRRPTIRQVMSRLQQIKKS